MTDKRRFMADSSLFPQSEPETYAHHGGAERERYPGAAQRHGGGRVERRGPPRRKEQHAADAEEAQRPGETERDAQPPRLRPRFRRASGFAAARQLVERDAEEFRDCAKLLKLRRGRAGIT